MKKNIKIILFILACLTLILSGSLWMKFRQVDIVTNQWIESIQSKNYNKFLELTEIDSLVKHLSSDHGSYLSKTISKDNQTQDFIESTKNTLLSWIYAAFDRNIDQIIQAYFTNDDIVTLVYSEKEIISFLNEIDWTSVKVNRNQWSFNNDHHIVKVQFYNKKLDANFEVDHEIKRIAAEWKIDRIMNFDYFLRNYSIEKAKRLEILNKNTKAKIDKAALITFFESKTFSYFRTFGNSTKHRIKIKNLSNQRITQIKIKVSLERIMNGEPELISKVVTDNRGFDPDQEIVIDFQEIGPEFYTEMMYHNQSPKAEIIGIQMNQFELRYLSDF